MRVYRGDVREVSRPREFSTLGRSGVEGVVEANAARSFSGHNIIAIALHAWPQVCTARAVNLEAGDIQRRPQMAHTAGTRSGFTR